MTTSDSGRRICLVGPGGGLERCVTLLTDSEFFQGVRWSAIEVFPMETMVQLYHFFVGGTRFETDKPSLTGTEIKALAGVNPDHQLFFRDDVNTPDREVRDTQRVELIARKEEDGADDRAVDDGEALELDDIRHYHGHFYAVPNSSYKRLKSNP